MKYPGITCKYHKTFFPRMWSGGLLHKFYEINYRIWVGESYDAALTYVMSST